MAGPQAARGTSSKRPNLLIVMSDEHNPSISSAYGHPFVSTPAMHRLAARGAVFDAAYCNSPLCVPSRSSFMTGKYVHRIGAWDLGVPLASDEPTWAHRLNALGYQTALIGRMHFIGPDKHHGFTLRVAEDGEPAFRRDGPHAYKPADWDAVDPAVAERNRRHVEDAGPGRGTPFQLYDAQVLESAKQHLPRLAASDGPWAACVSFISPHFPLTVPEDHWLRYFPEHADLPEIPPGHLGRLHPQNRRLRHYLGHEDIPDDKVRRARAAYYGLVSFFDDHLGQVLDLCDQLDLWESTVIVYVSDHGEMHGEHGMWWKSSFYESSVRIPMIVSWPGRFREGVRLARVVSLVDLVRTLLDLAGDEAPGLDGRSLTALLEGREPDGGGEALVEYAANGTDRPGRMIRRGRYKLNYYWREPVELFDLESDPGEFEDLSSGPEYRGLAEELTEAVLAGWDPAEIDRRVRESQARRRIMFAGEPPRTDRSTTAPG